MVKSKPFRPKKAEGLDLDSLNHLTLFKAMFNSVGLGKTGVRVVTSPSGEGYHVYCREGYSLREAEMLSDCAGRRRYWEAQGFTFTFQNRHNGRGSIVGREEEYNPFALAFWSVPR